MKKIIGSLIGIINLLIMYISKLIPKKDKLWVFGSWFGDRFADNSKQLYLYVIENNKDINAIWISNNERDIKYINSIGGKALKRKSFKGFLCGIRAEKVFMTQGYVDIFPLNIIGGAFKVQLWHGIALKKIGNDVRYKTSSKLIALNRKLNDKNKECDLYVAPSERYKQTILTAFDNDENKIMFTGQPRNDIFFEEGYVNKNEQIKSLKIKGKKIITYMPTFRDKTSEVFSFSNLNEEDKIELDYILDKNDYIIVEKSHFINKRKKINSKNVINIDDIDTQELLLNTDILITDYSSCYFDYLLLNRPIIHFAYDYEYYKNKDRGLYYDLKDVNGGRIVYNHNELINSIEMYIKNPKIDEEIRIKRKNEFLTFDNGGSSQYIVDKLLKDI